MRYPRLAPLLLPVGAGIVILLAAFGGCIISFGGYELAPADGGTGSTSTTTSTSNGTGGATSSSGTGGMPTTSVSSTTASTGGTGGECAGHLNPGLALPPADAGPPCGPADNYQCPANMGCLIAGPSSFICAGCVGCLPVGFSCMTDVDCGSGYQCYEGECETGCILPNGGCSAPTTCKPVGNTLVGLCLPEGARLDGS